MSYRLRNWQFRLLGTVATMLFILGVTGMLQAAGFAGAGTPCTTCGSRCYVWAVTKGGPCYTTGTPNTACIAAACQNKCDGCIPEGPGYVVDCTHPNCWFAGIEIGGGNLCDNGCFDATCEHASGNWLIGYTPAKHCGQIQVDCDGEESSVACSQCGCKAN